jgi:hypothetical protein
VGIEVVGWVQERRRGRRVENFGWGGRSGGEEERIKTEGGSAKAVK